jgi:pyruvate dehydrogenase E2 component (dihydrolipoamide acetyltransferase)
MMEFKMPSLGADMEDGTLVEWRKNPGDVVKRGDIIAEIETQKGLVEIEIFENGKVEKLFLQPGDKVKVGTTIALIALTEGEQAGKMAEKEPEAMLPAAIAEEPQPERIRISPLARRLAEESGLDLSGLKGTGDGGEITREDVETVLAGLASRQEKAREPGTGLRMAIAAAMSRSNREIPHYYLESRIDLRNAMNWLKETNAGLSPKERLLPAVLFIKAAALALRNCPELNAEWQNGLVMKKDIHIGFVVSVKQGGIVVPAVHHADSKSPRELMNDLNDLIIRAKILKLRSSELSDSTFTLTSVGEGGADTVYGLIYPPQTAILGLGRISEQAVAENGMLDVRPCVSATLAADHRASDGLSGSRFLSLFNQYLQKPENL